MGFAICLEESSTFPTKSAKGSLVAGVEGGGGFFDWARFGVSEGFWTFRTPSTTLDVSFVCDAIGIFSFSASRSFMSSTTGAPSINWKAFSFVRVCTEGIMGGPVTTRRGGGGAL